MLIVKMMRDTKMDMADDDTRKPFRLLSGVDSVTFDHDTESGYDLMRVSYGHDNMDGVMPESFLLGGNVYIMNENGRTISSYGPINPMPIADGLPK